MGVQLQFAAPATISGGAAATTIHRSTTAGGLIDAAGSLLKNDGQQLMERVDLGELHAALKDESLVTERRFASAIASLLPGVDAPPAATVSALFRAFDADGSGEVDEKELVAGCQALCSGDDDGKLRLAFQCFDVDGDGHLTREEVAALLRGTIEPAVRQLHAAIEFASFGGDGDDDGVDVGAIQEEAGGAARIEDGGMAGTVRVELTTKVGVASLLVPREALAADKLAGNSGNGGVSLDAFLAALVDGAMAKHDADGNATLEIDEFVKFARENAFLSAWFGHLASSESRIKASWKDDFDVT